ncbi:probable glutamate receptor [Palaemon carinicauda]|uniref:probable glutamate receptor n=1 Tax=Palaemon carinicauda TaxID=392227 RepID=UPI0035B5793F
MLLVNCAMLIWLSGASVYGRGNERGDLEISLALDFAEFYNIQHISIVTGESETDQGKHKEYDIWTAKFLRRIRTEYASVFRIRSYPKTINGTTTDVSQFHSSEESPDLRLGGSSYSHLIVQKFYTADHLNTFKKVFKGNEIRADWLLLSDVTFRDRLRQVYLPLNSKVTVATLDTEGGGSAVLWETYHVSPDFDLKESNLGYWIHRNPSDPPIPNELFLESFSFAEGHSNNLPYEARYSKLRHGFMYSMEGDAFSRRTNLMGLYLRCATLQEEPFIVIKRKKDGSKEVTGIVGSIFTHLQTIMNFSSNCYEVDAYGSLEDGQWNGLIGEIYNDQADIAVASIDVTKKRSLAVDFPIGVGYSKYIMYMKRPSNSDFMWRAYSKQFSVMVWIITVVFLFWVTILFYLHLRVTSFPSPLVFSEASFTIMGFILGQGTSIPLEKTTIRLIALTTLMTQVLLLVHYTSDLMSGLTAGPPLPRVSNLLEVGANPDLQLGYMKHISIDEYLRDSSVPAYRNIWEGIHARKLIDLASTNEDGFERVLDNKNYVYMTADRAFLYHYSQECRVYLLPNANFPTQFTFALKKKSSLTPVFQKVLLRMLSSGLIDKWERDWTPTLADCNTLETSPIELMAISVPLLLLGFGLVTSLLILALEIIVHKMKENGSFG